MPAPVKAVLRQGWTITPTGYVRCDLPYDPDLCLITEPDDEQFDADSAALRDPLPLYRYAVGELYPDAARRSEGMQWRLSDQGVELLLIYRSPTEREVTGVRQE